jgi:uncharacterized protein YggE
MLMRSISKFAFLFVLAMVNWASPVNAQEPGIITVSGEAAVMVEPDVAHLRLGVDTQDESPLEAQRRNSAAMANVIAAVVAMGVDENDIQTLWFHMHPVQDWNTVPPQVVGYMVSNNINVTVRDIESVGAVMAAATEAGSNTASSVSFGLLDPSSAYSQALSEAVEDATVKAQVIAHALGVRLGAVAHVGEMGIGGFIPFPVARAEMMFDGGGFGVAPGAVPVQSGELAVTARVQVSFYILP